MLWHRSVCLRSTWAVAALLVATAKAQFNFNDTALNDREDANVSGGSLSAIVERVVRRRLNLTQQKGKSDSEHLPCRAVGHAACGGSSRNVVGRHGRHLQQDAHSVEKR